MLAIFAFASFAAIRSWGISYHNIRETWNTGVSAGARSYLVHIFEVGAETFGILYLFGISDLRGAAAVVACQRICTTISKPAAIMSQVLVGKVAGQGNNARAAVITLQVAQFTFIMAALSFLAVLPFLDHFTRLMLGPEFADATPLMFVFMLSAVFRGHASAAVGILLGQGCPLSYMVLKFAVLLTSVALTVVLYPAHGPMAVAEAYFVTSIMLTVGISVSVVRQAGSIWALVASSKWQYVGRLIGIRSKVSSS
jgi:O-antigen/teichoic acid export membrane protein